MLLISFTVICTMFFTFQVIHLWAMWDLSYPSAKLYEAIFATIVGAICLLCWVEIYFGYTYVPKCVRYVMA